MKYMLDTNICIYIIKRKPAWVFEKFKQFQTKEIGISSITVSELQYGVEKSQHTQKNQRALNHFLLPLTVLSYDRDVADYYGKVRTTLETKGNIIGSLDLMIAAHALKYNVTLVTNNTKEFNRVIGLKLENWIEDPFLHKD
ncbi:type II toxin-antitoxin system VapC family toxin [Candidatus Albibeggiatoa sp. nov. BB20]|uniref:type II toxin-antitoxin system tRNA(fMet)-specific endonuclease VapC n=1 Tax=Candidatus Albibeggiatoa sp. nov. BB20 TaxID=3162723 RepID=UPI0033655762